MSLVSGLMIYAILWWLVLFMVLPFGIRTTREAGGEGGGEMVEGQAASAPVRPRVLMKMLVTTIISAMIMGLVVAFVEAEVFDFRAYFTSRD